MRYQQLGKDKINLDKFQVVQLSQQIQKDEKIVEFTV